jgi:hypothetical protein
MSAVLQRLFVAVSVVASVLALGVARADAQTPSAPAGRLHVAVGAGWLGGSAFGEQPADLRTASGNPYRLFETDTDLGATWSFEARVGVALSSRYEVEGRAAISRPELRTVVTSDAEATGTFTLVESLDQYVFDGGIVVRLSEFETMGLLPFAAAGVGYVRQLHEGQVLVEQGQIYYVGAGFTRAFFSSPQGLIRAASIRADFRLNVFSLELDEGSRLQGSVSGSLVLTF